MNKLVKDSVKTVSRTNEFGIRLLPESLRSILFDKPETEIGASKSSKAWNELNKFNLGSNRSEQGSKIKQHVELPKLFGNVETHFWNIGEKQIKPYIELLNELFSCPKFPEKPTSWSFTPGWTRYVGDKVEPVSAPLEHVFCFDVEVCVQDGNHPVMATALTTEAWYSWCSPHLINLTRPEGKTLRQSDLIPLTSEMKNKHRLVIGHNVNYDRARSSDEYDYVGNLTSFLDTMSLHIVVSGMSSEQRLMKTAKVVDYESEEDTPSHPKWFGETSLNNLNDVFQLYCKGGQPLKKMKRDVFVNGTLQDIQLDFQSLMSYCADDVIATNSLVKAVFPLFRERCPHPVTFAGMLEMGKCYLPISKRWDLYVRQASDLSDEMEEETEQVLGRLAKECVQLVIEEEYKNDLWMWDQDWTLKGLKFRKTTTKKEIKKIDPEAKSLEEKFLGLFQSVDNLFKIQPRIPGYPSWFMDLTFNKAKNIWNPNVQGLTPSKKIVPRLLRLSWMGYPLHRHDTEKWGFIAPKNDCGIESSFVDDDQSRIFPTEVLLQTLSDEEKCQGNKSNFETKENCIDFDDIDLPPPDYSSSGSKKKTKKFNQKISKDEEKDALSFPELPGCEFFRLPHKDGKGNNVGSPLAKDFLDKVKDGILSTKSGGLAAKVLMSGKILSYWRSNKDRITNQMRVTLDDDNDIILPQLVPAGTLTRRAVERTWLTASNAKVDRMGSELKTLVEAPKGYRLVGADVDSQELWIAAVLGDAHFTKEHGSTPLGWMTLQGTKAEGTDMHSMVAKTVGVSRDNAKILNYGRIYGAGINFAKQLLKRFNPTLDEDTAKKLANRMYLQTKGDKVYVLNNLGAFCYAGVLRAQGRKECNKEEFVGWTINKQELSQIVKFKRKLDLLFDTSSSKNNKDFSSWIAKPSGEDLILELGLDCNEKEEFSDRDVYDVIGQLGKSFGNSTYNQQSVEEWSRMVGQVTSRSIWKNGSESHSFNRLEQIALNWTTSTPVLGCRITRALDSRFVGTDYMPSRINWVVQSSAVDYLHLLLVTMKWLMSEYDIDGRFAISIHDEVRYVVKEEDCYRAALALQISNLLVRSMFCSKLGMTNLPEDVAYFSGVDIDRVMRKDPESECVTPSNPQGLYQGCGIEKGQSLSINEIVDKIGNKLTKKQT